MRYDYEDRGPETSSESIEDEMISQRPGGGEERRARHDDQLTPDDQTAAEDLRDEEEPDEMPGGAAAYAGRGDTGTDEEAPGGMEGYATNDPSDKAAGVPYRHSAKTDRQTRED